MFFDDGMSLAPTYFKMPQRGAAHQRIHLDGASFASAANRDYSIKAEGFSGELHPRPRIDAANESVYIRSVPVRKIQVGQVWKNNESGESFLVTKVYGEALATYAVLRKTGAEEEPPVRIKVAQKGASAELQGYTFTQESEEF